MAYQHTTGVPVHTTHQPVGTHLASAIPGTDAHAATHYGTTGHTAGTGGVAGAVHAVKEKIPGTTEHKMTHPTGTTGGVGGTVAHVKAQIPGTAEHRATHPGVGTHTTGVAHTHGTGESVTHKVLKHVPGTQAHAEKKAIDRATGTF